jgi:hypothetical protein
MRRHHLILRRLAGGLTIVIAWLTDLFEVVALSSRAFALFYALQCALALIVSVRNGGTAVQRIGFGAKGLVCLSQPRSARQRKVIASHRFRAGRRRVSRTRCDRAASGEPTIWRSPE